MTEAALVVDVDPETYCMDFREVEKSITNKTKAIISVYNYGNDSAILASVIKLELKL